MYRAHLGTARAEGAMNGAPTTYQHKTHFTTGVFRM